MGLNSTAVSRDWQERYQIGDVGPVPAIQVRQRWGENVVDMRHVRPSGDPVSIGAAMGWRWELLGVDMGWVDAPFHRVLPYAPPLWSEVNQRPKQPFFASEDSLEGADSHELFRWVDGLGWVATVLGHWTVRRDGEEMTLPDGESELVVGDGTLEIAVGGLVFDVVVVPAACRAARSPWRLDAPMLVSAGIMAAMGLGFGLIVAFAPAPMQTTMLEVDDDIYQLVMSLPPPETQPEPKPKVKPKPRRIERAVGPGRRSQERAGRGDSQEAANLQEVRASGLFASGAFDALDALSDIDSELRGLTGNLTAKAGGGPGIGEHGLGRRGGGLGRGGGPDALGGIDVFGGDGPPGGEGLGVKPGAVFTPPDETPMTMGGMNASEVDKVVKRHFSAIRYCYQRELTKDPSMSGKVSIHFTIASDGTVSKAKVRSTNLHNAAVETCVVNRFLKMQFPEPGGNGIVLVNYPFLFAPG